MLIQYQTTVETKVNFLSVETDLSIHIEMDINQSYPFTDQKLSLTKLQKKIKNKIPANITYLEEILTTSLPVIFEQEAVIETIITIITQEKTGLKFKINKELYQKCTP